MKSTLFSFSKVDALAQSLAQSITSRYPPVIANTPEQTVSQGRIEEILEEIFSSEFQSGSRLGILGRTKLRYAFKSRLRETGYDEKFIDFAAKKLSKQMPHRTE